VFVFVFSVAGRASSLLHFGPDHRDDGMVRQPPLARTVVIQDVTKPNLALLHQEAPQNLTGGGES
jgi:hypothetical protein